MQLYPRWRREGVLPLHEHALNCFVFLMFLLLLLFSVFLQLLKLLWVQARGQAFFLHFKKKKKVSFAFYSTTRGNLDAIQVLNRLRSSLCTLTVGTGVTSFCGSSSQSWKAPNTPCQQQVRAMFQCRGVGWRLKGWVGIGHSCADS